MVDIAPPFGDGVVDVLDLELLMSHWEQPVDDPTLLACWKLYETEGTIAPDSAGDCDGITLYTAEAPTIRNCLIEANCDDAIHVWGVMSFVLKDVNDSSVVQVSSISLSVVPYGPSP